MSGPDPKRVRLSPATSTTPFLWECAELSPGQAAVKLAIGALSNSVRQALADAAKQSPAVSESVMQELREWGGGEGTIPMTHLFVDGPLDCDKAAEGLRIGFAADQPVGPKQVLDVFKTALIAGTHSPVRDDEMFEEMVAGQFGSPGMEQVRLLIHLEDNWGSDEGGGHGGHGGRLVRQKNGWRGDRVGAWSIAWADTLAPYLDEYSEPDEEYVSESD